MILRSSDSEKSLSEKMAASVHRAVYERHVQFMARQKDGLPTNMIMVANVREKIESDRRQLAEEGYNHGPDVSHSLIMQEGQPFIVRMRGNIKEMHDMKEIRMIYNSQIKTRLELEVKVDDPFGQKTAETYWGYVQIFSENGKALTKEVLLELLVKLPKV